MFFFNAMKWLMVSIVNYLNRDVLLTVVVGASLPSAGSLQWNCGCVVFVLHVATWLQASVLPKPSIIEQWRGRHSAVRSAANPVVFSCLASAAPGFQSLIHGCQSLVWGTVTFLRCKCIWLLSLTRGYTWHITDMILSKRSSALSSDPTNWFWTCMQKILCLRRCL